ncbi:MAG: lysophospholipid acyltransferase family protein [Bacteroidetes bacterium]|nr:lysophospholipid acyltransferase family protein [Bacteroidota bacterium]
MLTLFAQFFKDQSIEEIDKTGITVGNIIEKIFPYRKKVIQENIKYFLKWANRPESDLDNLVSQNYEHMGMLFFENFWLTRVGLIEYTQHVTLEVDSSLKSALENEKPGVVLIGHLGNWELLVSGIPLLTGKPISFISKKIKSKSVNFFMHSLREQYLNRMVPTEDARDVINKILKSGKSIGLAADQSAPIESYWDYFIGRPVPMFLGPASFALKNRIPIYFLAPIRTGPGTFVIYGEEIQTDDLDPEEKQSLYILTTRHTRVLETYIKRYPEQYYWIHRRWKHTSKWQSYLPKYQH